MNIKRYARRIMKRLYDEGFSVLYYYSMSTSSVYIKLDYGVAHSITVRDHPGKKKYDYKFNVIDGLDESYSSDGRHYFKPSDFEQLIESIKQNRDMLKDKYGYYYNVYMGNGKKKVGVNKGFWQSCAEYKGG